MLNKITAAAISTVLCLTTAIPCTSDCSEQQTAETYASIAATAAVMNDTEVKAATTTTSAAATTTTSTSAKTTISASETTTTSTSAKTTISASATTTVTTTAEAEEKEPLEAGNLGSTISYELHDDGTLYISGHGIMENYRKSPFKSTDLIKKAVVTNTDGEILSIGSNVFSGCTGLTEIELPDSLIAIENNAFNNCSSLSNIHFDGADAANKGELVLSGSIEEIKEAAFMNCTSLESVIIPEATVSVGNNAFSDCSSLKKVVVNGESTALGSSVFNRCIALEELTLPFAAFCDEGEDDVAGRGWLGYLFNNSVTVDGVDYTYGVRGYNGFTYCIPLSLETITITGGKNIPENAFDGLKSLKKVIVPDDIAIIGNLAFRNCAALTEFDMPSKATYIGDEAFSGCAAINVDIPEGVTSIGASAFAGCTSITEITVPEATKTIGNRAFADCSALVKAVIIGGEEGIGDFVFNRCIALEDLTFPFAGYSLEAVNAENSRAWLGYLFNDPVKIDEVEYTYTVRGYNGFTYCIPLSLKNITITGGKNIPENAFDGLKSLKKVAVPDDITTIGNRSFRNCAALTEFELPSTVTLIGDEAFSGCAGIIVDIPEGVTSIGASAFAGCTSITEITVPEATKTIGGRAFADCSALVKAVIIGGEEGIGDFVFNRCIALEDLTLPFAGYSLEAVNAENSRAWLGYLFNDPVTIDEVEYTYTVRGYNGFTYCIPLSLKNITITGGKNIPENAFDGLKSLEKVAVPDDIATIGNRSFRNCAALTDFNMPSKATYIGDEAFSGCAAINVDIPEGVTSIGASAFAGCTSITEITVPEATKTIGDRAFADCSALKKAVVRGGSESIGSYIFNRCIALESLTLPFPAYSEDAANTEGNRAWLGYMFNDPVEGHTYPVRGYNGFTYNIPKTLKDLTFIGGEYMANNMLQGLDSLENVTLPGTMKEIGSSAFEGLDNLQNVYYPGTEEDWADVNVKEKNESLEGKMKFYKLGDPTDDGIIDAVDASYILALYAKMSTSSETPTMFEWNTCDVNRDGYIDAVDASTVLAYYAYVSTDGEGSLEEFMSRQ